MYSKKILPVSAVVLSEHTPKYYALPEQNL